MQDKDKRSNSRFNRSAIIASTFAIIVLAIIIFLATQSKITTTGSYPASTKIGSIICNRNNATYPYTGAIDWDKVTGTDIRVIGTFDESKIIEKIALDYTVYFTSKDIAKDNETFMHVEFALKLSKDKLDNSLFENKFSVIDKKVVMSLYAPIERITKENYLYLLLSKTPNSEDSELTLDTFKNDFKKKGYDCISTDEE